MIRVTDQDSTQNLSKIRNDRIYNKSEIGSIKLKDIEKASEKVVYASSDGVVLKRKEL